jgi:uncharacterized membrane protein YphA (DoxX/SURF4 family)
VPSRAASYPLPRIDHSVGAVPTADWGIKPMSRPGNVRSARSNSAQLVTAMIYRTGDVVRIAEKAAGPFLDLFIRLWLAEIFWTSGLVKLQNWTIALYLSAHDYPVSWLDPVTAAWLGETIELVCPPLLVFGLATRFAALPMLFLSLVIQFSFQALDQHLFWAVLFTWFVVKGAGSISLDALIGPGIAATALPLARRITRVFDLLSRWGDPAIKLVLRCWIAALFFRSGVMKITNFDMTQMLFHAQSGQWLLPPDLAVRFSILVELACLIFLVLGAGTRIMAILLIGLAALVDPTFQQQIDVAYCWMVFGLIALHGPGVLSVDWLVARALLRRFPKLEAMRHISYEGMPHVVIVGGGFGGVTAAKALRHAACRVTLIDRRNYFLFQPLVYQVATAGLLAGRYRRTHPWPLSGSAQHARAARRRDRGRHCKVRGDHAERTRSIRLPGVGDRCSPQLFRA